MQIDDLVSLVKTIQKYNCETQYIEVKAVQKRTLTKLYDTLSSFSNQDGGGTILFGLDEKKDFEIVGVYDPQDLQHKVAEQCKQMEIAVRPLFTVAMIENKMVVSAEIPGVDIADRPVYYKGAGKVKGSYIRVAEADEPMSDYEIYSYDAYHRRIKDDIRIADSTDFSILDDILLEKYILNIKENKPNVSRLSNDEILHLMGVIKGGNPTFSGIMCFSKYPQATYPQLCITAVVVPGTIMGQTGDEGERFISNKRIEGTIAEMLEEAVAFVKRNMREKTIIDDEGKRHDKPEYPIKAVREAILNALMHRDYSIHTEGAPIRIVMYSDRLEITNEGGLYGRITVDGLGKAHADTRNQTLTHILEVQKAAENRYSGIPTIHYEMEKMSLCPPEFVNRRGTFTVILKNSVMSKLKISNSGKTEVNEVEELIEFCKTPRTRSELAKYLGKTQYYAMNTIVLPLIESGNLKMTLPEKPKSKSQKYYS
ncbi:ATP-binding protein [Tannockella kyphosi]|uniref:ATP-binding protein n=1 Tax=Tannockella kyphosi TaxID=2899121 RepID=UPI002013126E|nr:ATP-binding protein [Tannockella kyphosi]